MPVLVTSRICSNSVHLDVCILLSAPTKTGAFQRHPHTTEEKSTCDKLKSRKHLPKVVQQHCVGEVSKSVTFVSHIIFLSMLCIKYCRHCRKMNRGLFFWLKLYPLKLSSTWHSRIELKILHFRVLLKEFFAAKKSPFKVQTLKRHL